MIVAYNALSVRPGVADGGATFTLNVLRHLPEELPEARIIVYVREGEDRVPAARNVEIVAIATSRGALGRIGVELLGLSRDLRRRGVDVLLSPNESLPLLLPCPVVVVAQNLVYHGVPDGFTGSTALRRARSRVQFAYWRFRMPRAYRRASSIIAVSEETQRVLTARAGLDAGRTIVAYEGADSFLLPGRPTVSSAERERRILVVSALAPYKGIEETLALFEVLRRTHPELKLEIVGSDWQGYGHIVRRAVADRGLEGSVWLRAAVTPDQLASLYASSLLLVLLSRCESFGLPLVEAMRYGLPVVAAERSSLPEVADGAALLVDPDRIDAAAELVAALIGDDAARAELTRRGLARASVLTWQSTAAAVARTVRSVSRGEG